MSAEQIPTPIPDPESAQQGRLAAIADLRHLVTKVSVGGVENPTVGIQHRGLSVEGSRGDSGTVMQATFSKELKGLKIPIRAGLEVSTPRGTDGRLSFRDSSVRVIAGSRSKEAAHNRAA